MTIEERLNTLEKELKQSKRYNRYLLGVVLVVVSIGIIGAAPFKSGKEIRATKFVLEDGNGTSRAGLMMDKDGPLLAMEDENGKTRVLVAIKGNAGPGIFLYDEKEELRESLSFSKIGPALVFNDENGIGRVFLSLLKPGPGPSLGLADDKGNIRVALGVMDDGPHIDLATEKGEAVWGAPYPGRN